MEKEKLSSLVENLSIPQAVKKEIMANSDLIEEEDLLGIVEEYLYSDDLYNNSSSHVLISEYDEEPDMDYMYY